jgi:hypothetical protein
MSLILRLGLLTVLLGLLAGLVARVFLPRRYLPLVLAVSTLPVLAHLGYLFNLVLAAPSLRAAAFLPFGLIQLVLAIGLFGVTLRLTRAHPPVGAAYPLVLLVAYALGLRIWLSLVTSGAAPNIDTYSYALLFWGSLFVSGALLTFLLTPRPLRVPRIDRSSVFRRRR